MLEWLLANVDLLVASGNFTIASFMAFVFGLLVYTLNTRKFNEGSDLKLILTGGATEAFGWFCHRTYWGIWRYFRDIGDLETAELFIENGWVTLIFQAIIIVGIVMLLTPVWKALACRNDPNRRRCFVLPISLAFAVYWFFFISLQSLKIEKLIHREPKQFEVPLPERNNVRK